MTTELDLTPYIYVNRLEAPLSSARRLSDALALITETIEEPYASAMNEIVRVILGHLDNLEEVYTQLFRLHHPDRERFEREGLWPKSDEVKGT